VTDALPSDPERQLKVAQGIIDAAFRQKAAEMGVELQRLRMAAADKDSHIRSLESRLAECQDNLRDTRSQVKLMPPLHVHACITAQRCPGRASHLTPEQRLPMAAADMDSHIVFLEGHLAECQETLRDTLSQSYLISA